MAPLAFIPVAAIGRATRADGDRQPPFRRWAMVHHPAEACRRCGRPVVISYRGRNRTKNSVYCTVACAEAHIAANNPPPRPKGPAATPPRCRHPEKVALPDEASAREYFATLLARDGTLDVYECPAGGHWHAGHSAWDEGQTIAAIARIRTSGAPA